MSAPVLGRDSMPARGLLDVRDLRMHISTYEGVVKAVDGIDLEIGEGQIVGLVGESGSGKSMTSRTFKTRSMTNCVPSVKSPNGRTERRVRPSASESAIDVARPRSLQ